MGDISSNRVYMNETTSRNTNVTGLRHRLSLRRPKSATPSRVMERQHWGMDGFEGQRTGIQRHIFIRNDNVLIVSNSLKLKISLMMSNNYLL